MGKPLVVLVHGVGRQLRLDTMKSFLHGIAGPSKYNSRAHLAEELIEKKELCLEWLPFDLVEFNYSKLIFNNTSASPLERMHLFLSNQQQQQMYHYAAALFFSFSYRPERRSRTFKSAQTKKHR